MDDEIQRRTLLGGLAAGLAGTAGCTELVSALQGESSPTPTSNDETDTTPTATERPATAWGETIPTYPYRETSVPPLDAKPDPEVLNPVLTTAQVTDADARFVADPFLFVEDGEWHMFFEAMVRDRGGVIAHATSPDEGITWSYDQIVLQRPYHLSFPLVFKWKGEYYMTTEERNSNQKARLYRASSFPTEWVHEGILYDASQYGHGVSDHVLFQWNDRWWSLTGDGNTHAYAYYSDSLSPGGWKPHENNPIINDRPKAARPGGRPIVREDGITMFYQDSKPFYGESVRAYRITDLSPTTYKDRELSPSPVIDGTGKDEAWNGHRMHHYDPWHLGDGRGWRVAVDGDGFGDDSWNIGIYRVPGPE